MESFSKCLLTSWKLAITLLRVFVDQEGADAFEDVFKFSFKVIADVTNEPVTFQHIHDSGFASMVSDMDQGQLLGMSIKTIWLLVTNWPYRNWAISI